MNQIKQCQKCGATLAATVLHGLCPNCLVLVTFDSAADQPTQADEATRTRPPDVQAILSKTVRYLGDYELVEEIARGAMGVVFKARQVSLNRLVAVKMILRGHFADPKEVQRFKTEAEAAAGLAHPNLVGIYEVGEHEGLHYYSMQLVTGSSLAQCGHRYLDEFPGAVRLMAKAARAVHHAHQHGILHRDLKPGNILVDAAGEPHITDFGLAKDLEGSSDLTQADSVLGTPAFMAPEQALGLNQHLTTAADIYSLGAVLFHLLTGKAPFSGQNTMQVLKLVAEAEPPRPSALNPRVDRDLETICLKCLEKAPERRYGSAEALAEDLERWLRKEPILARPLAGWERTVKWVRRRPSLAALACALLLVSAGGLAAVLWQVSETRKARNVADAKAGAEAAAKKEAQGERQRAESLLSESQLQLAERSLKEKDVGAAAGQLAAVLRRDPANLVAANKLLSLLMSKDMIVPAAAEPQVPPGFRLEAIHPDMQHIVLSSNDVVEIRNVVSNRLSRPPLRCPHRVVGVCFDPSGKTWLIGTTNRLYARQWPDDALLWEGERPLGFFPLQDIKFSADGGLMARRIASGIAVIRTKTGELAFPPVPSVTAPVLSPDGKHLAAVALREPGSIAGIRVFSAGNGSSVSPLMQEPDLQAIWFVAGGPYLATFSGQNPRVNPGTPIAGNTSVWDFERGVKISSFKDDYEFGNFPGIVGPGVVLGGGLRFVKQRPLETASIVDSFNNAQPYSPFTKLNDYRDWHSSPDGNEFVQIAGLAIRMFDRRTSSLLSESFPSPHFTHRGAYSAATRRIMTWAGYDDNLTHRRTSYDPRGIHILPWQLLRENHTIGVKEIRSSWVLRADEALPAPASGLLMESEDFDLRVFDVATLAPAGPHLRADSHPIYARMSRTGLYVAAVLVDRQRLHLWNGMTGLQIPVAWDGLSAEGVGRVRFGHGERHCVVSFTNKTIAVVALPEGRVVAVISSETENVERDIYSEDGGTLLRLTDAGKAKAYHLPTGALQCELTIPDTKTLRGHLSPSGRRALISGFGSSYLYDLESGTLLGEPLECGHGHQGGPVFAQFSRDDRTIIVWHAKLFKALDARSGKPLGVAIPGDLRIATPSLSQDGSVLVYRDGMNSAFTLNLVSGSQRQFTHISKCRYAAINPAGSRLLTASDEGVFIWDIGSGHRVHGPVVQPNAREVFFTDSPERLGFICQLNNHPIDQRMILRLAEIPDAREPVPSWLPDLADAIGGRLPGGSQTSMSAWGTTTARIQEILKTAPAADYYANWARWFLSPPEARRATPDSPYTTQEYVEQLSAIGTLDTLREATRLSPTNALAHARLAKVTLDQPEAATQFYLRSEADHLSLLATTLDPVNLEVKRMREDLLKRLASLRQSP